MPGGVRRIGAGVERTIRAKKRNTQKTHLDVSCACYVMFCDANGIRNDVRKIGPPRSVAVCDCLRSLWLVKPNPPSREVNCHYGLGLMMADRSRPGQAALGHVGEARGFAKASYALSRLLQSPIESISGIAWLGKRGLGFPTTFLTMTRGQNAIVTCSLLVATIYLMATFDRAFVLGYGAFWENPVGASLQKEFPKGVDVLNLLIGYRAFLHTGWHLPLFFVHELGAPTGTNIIYLDAIPPVALIGKIVSILAGTPVNPYGVWVAGCFILSAVFAALLVGEAGQRTFIAAAAASLLAVSAPPLLNRFGHVVLLSHFLVVGALFLYLRDRRAGGTWIAAAYWVGWLCLAALINPYLFSMCAVIYGASLLSRWHQKDHPSRLRMVAEPVITIAALACVAAIAGHFGRGTGTSPFAPGFGRFSMNLASPFWPHHSGLFPDFDTVVDATDGQYEGFNYFGFGALVLISVTIVLNARTLRASFAEHRYLCLAFAGLFVFALSDRVFLGSVEILDVDYSWRVDQYLGVFRSSGRMFWPIFYAIALFALAGVLRRLPRLSGIAVVGLCCLLQLVDTNPWRTRLTRVTANAIPTVLNQGEWEARMTRASEVRLEPSYQCKGGAPHTIPLMELQLAAAVVGRPINSVYNARLKESPENCAEAAASARNGPWAEDKLYVFLAGEPNGVPADWMPRRPSCERFSLGVWCLGPTRN